MPDDADVVEEMRAQQQSHVRAYDKTQAESRGSNGEDDNGDESASEPTESESAMKASQSSQSLSGFSEAGAGMRGNSFKSTGGYSEGQAESGASGTGNGVARSGREASDAGRNGQSEANGAEDCESTQDGDEGGSGEQGNTKNAQDLNRKSSGHWAHVEGTTLRSNQPSQGPSGFSGRNGAAPRKAGPANGPDLDHAEKQQGPATNNAVHRPGLVQTSAKGGVAKRRPYRVEMVGVACDAGLSVVRGMR